VDGGNECSESMCDRGNSRALTVAARKHKSKAIFGSLGDLTSRIAKVPKTGVRILPNSTAAIRLTQYVLGIIPVSWFIQPII
jgi:hypothetical protein